MLLPVNSRIRNLFLLPAAMVFSLAANAQPSGKISAHTLPLHQTHAAHHAFLTRLPRTSKARKYDKFFLNQLPRQATASARPVTATGEGQFI